MLLGDGHCYCHFIDGEMATQKNEILAQGQYASIRENQDWNLGNLALQTPLNHN